MEANLEPPLSMPPPQVVAELLVEPAAVSERDEARRSRL